MGAGKVNLTIGSYQKWKSALSCRGEEIEALDLPEIRIARYSGGGG